jgi:hypothetical protein
VIFVPAYSACAGRIVKALRLAGFRGLILGGDSWNGEQAFAANCGDPGDAAFSTAFSPDAPGMQDTLFWKLYLEQNKRPPTVYEMLGFDSMLLAAAVTRATSGSEDVLMKFEQLRQFHGGAGTVFLKEGGDVSRPVYINRVFYRKPAGPAEFRYERTIPPNREVNVSPKQNLW